MSDEIHIDPNCPDEVMYLIDPKDEARRRALAEFLKSENWYAIGDGEDFNLAVPVGWSFRKPL